MELSLAESRVLITGASRGIGLGIAKGFLDESANVTIVGRSKEQLTAIASELAKSHKTRQVRVFAGDLTAPHTQEELIKFVESEWPALDALVLNLGSGASSPGMDVGLDEWHRVLDLNLHSSLETLRLAVPLLRQGKDPAVVFIGSIAGLECLGAPIAYAAAKAALTAAMKCSARLLADFGIRVNMVAPGNILFEGGTWDKKRKADKLGVAQMLHREVPLKRLGTVEEVASAVLFLASPRASFITGSCLVVDGGQTRGFTG